MQVAATMASSTLLEAAAAAQKAQHQLASLEFSMAAFAEAQQEVSLLQQVSELPIMPWHCCSSLIHIHSSEHGLHATVGMTRSTATMRQCIAWNQSVLPDARLVFMQEVSAVSKAAAAKEQSHIQCKTAVADLRERLKQNQQLLEACACTDGSAAVQMDQLQDQLRAARYEICPQGTWYWWCWVLGFGSAVGTCCWWWCSCKLTAALGLLSASPICCSLVSSLRAQLFVSAFCANKYCASAVCRLKSSDMQQKQEDLAAKVSTKRWPLCCLLSHIILSNLRLTKAKFCQIPGYELMGCDALFFAMGQCLLRHQFGQQPL